jgi:simple sugar transport system permease protein
MDIMNSQTNATAPEVTQHYKESFSFRRFTRAYSAQLGILGVFIALWLIFIISAPDTFLSPQIYTAFMTSIPFFAITAIPLTIVVVAKEIDLSFPSIMAMGMVAFSFAYNSTDFIGSTTLRVFLGIIAALLTGTIIGWLNGFIVVKFGIPSLVVTIGTQFFWRGAVLVLTSGTNFPLTYIKETVFQPILVGKIGGFVPMQMIWLIVVTIAGWVILNRHKFGAHVYLTGDNVNSAELMGINTGRVRIKAFMLIGLVAATADARRPAGSVGALVPAVWPPGQAGSTSTVGLVTGRRIAPPAPDDCRRNRRVGRSGRTPGLRGKILDPRERGRVGRRNEI